MAAETSNHALTARRPPASTRRSADVTGYAQGRSPPLQMIIFRSSDDVPADGCSGAGVSACVREIWARRHVLVHNRGVPDARYVARVSGATAGAMLHVDGEYLSTAIDLLCGFLLLEIILLAWAARPV